MATLQEQYGRPLVEPREPVVLDVTRADIRKGAVQDGEHCAIAQAARRKLHAEGVRIGPSTSTLIFPDHIEVFQTGPDARNLLRLFDVAPGSVSPTTVTLLPLTPSQRQASRAEYNRARDERKAAGIEPVPAETPHTYRPRVNLGLRNTTGVRPSL